MPISTVIKSEHSASTGNPRLERINTRPLVCFTDDQDRKLTPAFTGIGALRHFDPNTPYRGLMSRAYSEMIANYCHDIQGIILNPFDTIRKPIRPGGAISRPEFEILARKLVPTFVTDGLVKFHRPSAGLEGFVKAGSRGPSCTSCRGAPQISRRFPRDYGSLRVLHERPKRR